ncbi:MAG: Zn-dependent exopeptidase M28 [Elusimicrobia bacterium]|nr:Zn-dependent exopeptidase M28 [Elusimicrobiota bacterium]
MTIRKSAFFVGVLLTNLCSGWAQNVKRVSPVAARLPALTLSQIPNLQLPILKSLVLQQIHLQNLSPVSTEARAHSLNRFFDQVSRDSSSPGPVPSSSALDPVEAFVQKARGIFFPLPVQTEGVPTDEELWQRINVSPLTNPERLKAIVQIYQQAGAKPEDITLQKIGNLDEYNVIVVKPGKTDRVIVVGGHYDKVRVGRGVIDNWSGATMVANMYQALRDVETEHTIVFMAFGAEERGLVGSRHYVQNLSKEQLGKIDAMLNLDTMAVDGTFSLPNGSDRFLIQMANEVAKKEGFALKEQSLWGGDSDHSSFRRAGIPAAMLYGVSKDVIWEIIHSDKDNINAFSMPHYKNAFLLSTALVKTMDTGVQPRRQPRVFGQRLFSKPLRPWWTRIP